MQIRRIRVLLTTFVLGWIWLGCGCTRLPPPSAVPTAAATASEDAGPIADALRKNSDLATCRTAIDQLNANLARSPDQHPVLLTEGEQQFLRKQFALDEGEWREINSTSFTLLDAQHLEQCLLLRDAARTLPVVERTATGRALAAFRWVMRQVRLVEGAKEIAPVGPVLRRGWGDARERALVFLALLEQLDVPGCLIGLRDREPLSSGLAAALLDGQVLLFDCRLGEPLTGLDGQGITTLAQMRSGPEWLAPLGDIGYDITAEQGRSAEPALVCSLSALAPRLRRLEKLLAGFGVRVSCDPQQQLRQWQQVPGLAGARVGFCGPGKTSPTGLLREFVLPNEGGNDQTFFKRREFEFSLTPWQALPQSDREIPEGVELGIKLRNEFERPFVDLIENPGRPRDLMLRGRLAEAVARLVQNRDEWEKFRTEEQPITAKEFSAWCASASKAQADLLLARRRLQAGGSPQAQAALAEAQASMDRLWKEWGRQYRYLMLAASQPLQTEMNSWLALAKHEQAEAAQAQGGKSAADAWRSAAEWWLQCQQDNPSSSWQLAARLGQARALEVLSQHEQALAVLTGGGDLQGWNQKALRFRIQQLKGRSE